MTNVQRAQKMIPFITSQISMGQYVCELVFGVNEFDLHFGSRLILSNNQSRATLWFGQHVALSAPSLYDQFDHCFVVFEHIQQSFTICGLNISGNQINVMYNIDLLWDLFFSFTGCPVRSETWEIFPKTETIRSHNSRAGKPSSLNPVSREIISDSVELWETDVCFLHIQLIGTNVWLPKTHNVPQVIRSVVLTLPVVYNRPTSTVNDISVTKICWFLESLSSEVFDKRLWMRVITSLYMPHLSCLP